MPKLSRIRQDQTNFPSREVNEDLSVKSATISSTSIISRKENGMHEDWGINIILPRRRMLLITTVIPLVRNVRGSTREIVVLEPIVAFCVARNATMLSTATLISRIRKTNKEISRIVNDLADPNLLWNARIWALHIICVVQEKARERETYQVHSRGCGRLRSGVVGKGWVSSERLEGGVMAASRGEREGERPVRELVVESQPAELRGDGGRERLRENGGEVGEKMEGGVIAKEMGFEREFGETRVKEARERKCGRNEGRGKPKLPRRFLESVVEASTAVSKNRRGSN
ncbi:hypothetical protein TIFTF001_035440 [Ficus carica]|uniref:Uncharacterized protein n=1 Tax=Ficus carica TaxID=3494 RepID=A0AA88E5M1_FICCA|nr:hypothetical protein TIFTF001_035440 [Ficus carica]